MDAVALMKIGDLLLQVMQLGPVFAKEVAAIRSAGSASADDQAKLDAQIEALDVQRLASWAQADAALGGG